MQTKQLFTRNILIGRRPLLLAVMLLSTFASLSLAAPYGPEGKEVNYRQPDGSTVKVRVFGDEFYAVAETEEGYTVVYDQDKVLRFGQLSADGKKILPTNVRATNKPDHATLQAQGLKKGIRVNPKGRKEAINKGLARMRADSKGRITPASVQYYEQVASERSTDPVFTQSSLEENPPPPPAYAPPAETRLGQYVGLTILVDFPDQVGTIPFSEVDDFCNAPGYTGDGNAASIYQYFHIQSGGRMQYNNIVTAYVRMSQPKGYYDDGVDGTWGNSKAQDLVAEALDILIADGFDFTQLSTDSSGRIYSINIFYAGTVSSGWSTGLWPHQWAIPTKTVDAANGIKAYWYQMTDMGTALDIGTFCHENGHMLMDYPDLYSYNGNANNNGSFTLMAGGNSKDGGRHPTHIDPYLKSASGWAEIVDLDSSSHQRCTLEVDANRFYRYRNPSKLNEYFLFELRDNTGYEGTYGGSSVSVNPAAGLVAYHIVEDGSSTYSTIFTANNPTNDYSTPYELMIIEASPTTSVTPWYDDPTPSSADAFKASGVSTIPSAALQFWDATGRNTASGATIHSISADGPTMTFVIGAGDPPGDPAVVLSKAVIDSSCDAGQNASSKTFTVGNAGGGTLNYSISDNQTWLSCTPTSGSATTESDTITVNFSTSGLSAGSYSATITVENTFDSSTETITVNLTVNPQPTIGITGAPVTENGTAGISGPQTFIDLQNTSGGTMTYTISNAPAWLTPSPLSGTVLAETDRIYLDFDATSLSGGTYSNTLYVVSPEASNSPQAVSITYNVQSTDMIVIAPNGGESWYAGQTKEIRWSSSLGGTVKIELYKGGVKDSDITASTTNDGSYDWSIPGGHAAGTDYTVKITSNEQTSKNDISNADFEIATGLVSLPYSQDFESGLGTMTQSYVGGTLDWRTQTGGYTGGSNPSSAHGGTGNAVLQEGNYSNSTTRLITPVFDSTGLTNLTVNFWHAQVEWPPDQDTLKVYYSTNEGTDWTLITGADYTASIATWTERNLSIPSSANRIAFVGACNYGYGVCIDDILISGDQLGPNVSVEATDPTASEEGQETGTWTVTNSGDNSSDVTVNFTLSGTATGGGTDYNVSAASSVTILSGETTATVTLTPEDDSALSEGNETATLTIDSDAAYTIGSPSSADITITDNDEPGDLGFYQASHSVSEDGTSVRIFVTRNNGSTGAVSIDFATADGTASAGSDYTATNGTLNWVNGSMITNFFDVTIADNSLYTGDRAFDVNLSNPTGGAGLATTNATVTIQEDEVLPSIPTGLNATTSIGQIDLSWNASSNTTSYKVKRALTSGGAQSVVGTPVGTSYSDTNVTNANSYYYTVVGVSAAGESADSAELEVVLLPLLPFSETFDGAGMSSTLGEISGQNGWTGGTNALVQAGVGRSGNGLSIAADMASIDFANGTNTLVFDFWSKPVAGAEPAGTNIASNATAVIWVDVDNNFAVYSNETIVTLPVQAPSNAWIHFEVQVDYDNDLWDLTVDGTNIASGLGTYSSQSKFVGVELSNTSPEAAFFDDLTITGPASLTDYDNWLMNNFGTTSINGNTVSSNGVNTIYETYIMGLDPNDTNAFFKVSDIAPQPGSMAVNWSSVSGRVYNVYWSSNLLSGNGFILIQSNIPWSANNFTDSVHGAENKGYYRIGVQLQE